MIDRLGNKVEEKSIILYDNEFYIVHSLKRSYISALQVSFYRNWRTEEIIGISVNNRLSKLKSWRDAVVVDLCASEETKAEIYEKSKPFF